MSEMIERAAAAIREARNYGNATDESVARAAIAAMREPSSAMIVAVLREEKGMIAPEKIKRHWRAAIDAALKP